MWALVDVSVSANAHGPTELISVWVGAAFIDRLVIPRTQIAALGLNKAFSTEAILADGQLVELETYSC